jgi:hypothetical protein
MNAQSKETRSFGVRASRNSDSEAERRQHIESRKAEIEQRASRRRLLWQWAMHFAGSGTYDSVAAVEAQLHSMGFTEPADLLTVHDRRDIDRQLVRRGVA